MRRWQVKGNPSKAWGDKGPDLLRTKANASAAIKRDLGDKGTGWYARVNLRDGFGPWQGPVDRAELLEAFDDWAPGDLAIAQYGRKQGDGSGYDVAGVVRCRVIAVKDHAGTTADTDKVIALCEAAYPQGAFGGGAVCKQISGSSSWSQHAYGRAYDHSAYAANDALTDWALRMARENAEGDVLLPVNQILGSQGGRVGNASAPFVGPWAWRQGGVDSSHLWHGHFSTGKTQGTGVPPCAKGKAALAVEQGPQNATDEETEPAGDDRAEE